MPLVRKPNTAAPSLPASAAAILEGLSSSSDEARWSAARAAAGIVECARAVAAALRIETVARVREALFTALARMGHAGVEGVLPLLRSDDANLRAGALDALRIMTRSAPELLPPLLGDADVDVRILSCDLARALPGAAATALLCELLRREPDPNVCAAAIDVLAEVGDVEALPVLAECAVKFRDTPFLAFAIQVTTDRIRAQPALPRG
jgi:HEAT repeat protein